MYRRFALPTAMLLMLGACGDGATVTGADGTSISFGNDADASNSVASIDGNSGELSVDLPGFKAKIDMPKINLDASDFDMNGVKLFPGSKIQAIDINNGVTVSFGSPAAAPEVAGWFLDRLNNAGFKLSRSGNTLSGTSDEGKAVRIEMQPGAQDASSTGRIVIAE